MLTELRIRNLAIIDAVTLPLAPGFNVLSGETGAGKSIIVGALGLLIGERASGDLVRTGADKATVEGIFDIAGHAALVAMLDARGIELVDDGTLVLKREVVSAAGGRTRAWVNGSPVTAGVLAEIGRALVNVHGQHEAQALLEPEAQRHILDAFGEATREVQAVASAHAEVVQARAAIASLAARRDDATKRADWLQHVAREIGDAALKEGEEERLEEEARRLTHGEELQALIGEVTGALDGDAALGAIGHLQKPLAALQRIDPATARLQELYDAAWYALEELAREAQAYADGIELDPARLDEVERRRDLIFRLTKKYGGSMASVLVAGREARAELDLLDTAGLDLRSLDDRVRSAEQALASSAAKLTAKRRNAAAELTKSVESRLPDLGMPDGRFLVALTARGEALATGAEDVEFRVALNVGHDARPLARVASGGELARVMLALKTILARLDGVPTLIFDEVDAGIGGRTGLMVGDAMRDVAAHHQVFAITHLPQIAARAHHHIVVRKGAKGGVTTSDVALVQAGERVDEIARMLGGDAESATSREHARELIAAASRPREDLAGAGPGKPSASAAAKSQRPKRRV